MKKEGQTLLISLLQYLLHTTHNISQTFHHFWLYFYPFNGQASGTLGWTGAPFLDVLHHLVQFLSFHHGSLSTYHLLIDLVALYLSFLFEKLIQIFIDVLEIHSDVYFGSFAGLHDQHFGHGAEVGIKEEEKLVSVDPSGILKPKNIHYCLQVRLIWSFGQSKAGHIQFGSIYSEYPQQYLPKFLVSNTLKTPLSKFLFLEMRSMA